MSLADQIIDNGPYVAGQPLPPWALRSLASAEINELRDELVAGRNFACVRCARPTLASALGYDVALVPREEA